MTSGATNLNQQCFSVPEAARKARVSESLAWKHIRQKRLQVTKLGRRTIVTPEAYLAWINNKGEAAAA
jgi:hypothetical protein